MIDTILAVASNTNEKIWIALISGAGTLATAFGLNKIVPAVITWAKEKREEKASKEKASKEELDAREQELKDEIAELKSRLNILDRKYDNAQRFEMQTRATFNAMLPLMKEIMGDHPTYVALLIKLEKNILGTEVTSAQGTKK